MLQTVLHLMIPTPMLFFRPTSDIPDGTSSKCQTVHPLARRESTEHSEGEAMSVDKRKRSRQRKRH